MTRPRLLLSLAAVVAVAALLAATACGGSSSAGVEFPTVVSLGKGEVFPSINNHVLGLGDNRISMSLIDKDDNPVLGASVHLRFFDLNGAKPVLKSESDARFIQMQLSYVDEQSGNRKTETGQDGVYVAHATFDETGDWGVEATVTRDGRTLDPVPFRFNVLDRTPEPQVGDPAPPSRQPTLASVSSIDQVDSSYPPRPQMHQISIADALATGKPLVIAFATPAFCQSRTCAPVMDTVMDPLYEKYNGQAIFIHVEPYDLQHLRQTNVEEPIAATREWQLATEPWVFVVDRQGRIAGKFQGIMAADEVESALQAALAGVAATPAAAPAR